MTTCRNSNALSSPWLHSRATTSRSRIRPELERRLPETRRDLASRAATRQLAMCKAGPLPAAPAASSKWCLPSTTGNYWPSSQQFALSPRLTYVFAQANLRPDCHRAGAGGNWHRLALQALVRLPRRSREVLVLRFYLDMTDQEVAAVGGTRGTVSSSGSRALAVLARELKEEL